MGINCYCPKSSGKKDGKCKDCGGVTDKSEKPKVESKVQFVKTTDLVDVAKKIEKEEKVKKKKTK